MTGIGSLLDKLDAPMGDATVQQLYSEAKQSDDYDDEDVKDSTVAVAAVYLSARVLNYPMHPAEVTRYVNGVDVMDVSREARKIDGALDLGTNNPTVTEFALRYGKQLNLSEQEAAALQDVISDMDDVTIGTRSVRAAAAVYLASQSCPMGDDAVTQQEVADVANRSEVAVRKAYDSLRDELEIDVDIARTTIGDITTTIATISDELDIDADTHIHATTVADEYLTEVEDGPTKKTAGGVAGAAVHSVTDDVTLSDLSDIVGVSGQTISRIGKEVRYGVDVEGVKPE